MILKERMCGYLGSARGKKFKEIELKEMTERSFIYKSDFEEIKECQKNILEILKSMKEDLRRTLITK